MAAGHAPPPSMETVVLHEVKVERKRDPPPPLPPRELSPLRVARVREREGECREPSLTKDLDTLRGDETLAGEKPEANPKPDSQERGP